HRLGLIQRLAGKRPTGHTGTSEKGGVINQPHQTSSMERAMHISADQLAQLDRDGFLVLPNRFTPDEVDLMRSRLAVLCTENHPGNIIERASGQVRTAMGLHLRDDVYARVARHPRLVEPALQVLGEDAYIQQVKVNVKAAFSGEIWQWHYDFATHHEEDGVPEPRALNLHIFLDDVTEFNGPLYFVPGSHKTGDHGATLDTQTTSYPLWVCNEDRVRKLVEDRGIVSAKGPKGTMLIFHDTLVHGSPNNMSPWDRAIFSVIVNPVSNALQRPTRPEFKHHQDLTAIVPLEDECLKFASAAE
ncbi:MAG TPA: phytanoyl-CoA dioxygenase family protein, partial [Thermohalobaculum sp.]|nr:phytanoyl-CoA dioxygenase family protein [Thermohalobaculum sp.]